MFFIRWRIWMIETTGSPLLPFVPNLVEIAQIYHSGEDFFKRIIWKVFLLFCYYFHLKIRILILLKNIRSRLVKELHLKSPLWFFKVSHSFLLFCYLSPLEEVHDASFERTWIPFTKEFFVPSLVEIGSVVLKKVSLAQVS